MPSPGEKVIFVQFLHLLTGAIRTEWLGCEGTGIVGGVGASWGTGRGGGDPWPT